MYTSNIIIHTHIYIYISEYIYIYTDDHGLVAWKSKIYLPLGMCAVCARGTFPEGRKEGREEGSIKP